MADSLATSTSNFNVPENPIGRYEIEVRHRPSIPNNVKNWQVFEDDKQIHQFLTLAGDFEGAVVDKENEIQEEVSPTYEPLQNQIISEGSNSGRGVHCY